MIIVLSMLLFGSNGYWLLQNREQMRVVDVHDGDTFTLKSGDRVKLLGDNAPELGNCMADKATEKLKELVNNKIIELKEEKRDTYGRRMGLVYVDGQLINEQMLKQGLARPDYTSNSQSDLLKSAYKEASDNGIGIHSDVCKKTNPKPPNSKCVIKGNIDKASWEHFYHLPNCRHYSQIVLDTDLGESYFCSEKEAQVAGFHLAPDCLR